jgi:uncharacterized integral membrane protein
MKFIKTVLLTSITIIFILFAVANRQDVALHLFFSSTVIEVPLFIIIFVLLLLGVLLGGIANLFYGLRWRRKARLAEDRNRALEQEIAALKATSSVAEIYRQPAN